jgi:protein-disulfide isomerase
MSSSSRRLAAVILAATLVAAGAIAISAASQDPRPVFATVKPAGGMLAGIPERRGVLGSARARVTVTEFVDPQCPVCAAASRDVLPQLIERYVRPGKIRLDARVLQFIGPDSVEAARYAEGAREQDRLWPFLETLYANQGQENSGYVTPAFLAAVARAAGAVPRAGSDAALGAANAEAKRLGVDATPTFVVERPGEKPQVVDAAHLDAALGR